MAKSAARRRERKMARDYTDLYHLAPTSRRRYESDWLLAAFRSVVHLAKHLAIGRVGFPAQVPWFDVIAFHLVQLKFLLALGADTFLPLVSFPFPRMSHDRDRTEFSKRLAEAMDAMGLKARPNVLMTRFNSCYRGRSISFQSASRWLNGQAFPRPDKLALLAELFRVEPQTLLYGEKKRMGVREQRMFWPDRVTPRDQVLFEDFLALPAKQRDVVRNLIDSLTETAKKQKPD
jgi:transcriptional regulator with XRE-family HTH domain